MAAIDNFIEAFGVHLFSNRNEFGGITAMELEQMAEDLHDARDSEPMPEEKARLPPESQRKYQDSRELATLAWLWAAAANAVLADNKEKFHNLLEKAAKEFVYEGFYAQDGYRAFYEEGALLCHMQERANLLGMLTSSQNRDKVYELMRQYSQIPRPDPISGKERYSDDANRLIARHAVKIISDCSYAHSTPVPRGEKKQTLMLRKSEVEDMGRKVEADLENASVLSLLTGKKKKLAEKRSTLILEAQKLQDELDSYDPLDDSEGYSAADGRGALVIDSIHIEFFDLLGIANRMIYEARAWQAGRNKTPGISQGKLDMSIMAPSISHVIRYNADYGVCPVAFDSDKTAWEFSAPYRQHPGVYRRNAIGWIATK